MAKNASPDSSCVSLLVLPIKANKIFVDLSACVVLNECSACFWETKPFSLTVATHTSSLLLKLCCFLCVCYCPLHKAHRLVHVAFNSVNHSTLTWAIVSGVVKSKIRQFKKKREREREWNKKQSTQIV